MRREILAFSFVFGVLPAACNSPDPLGVSSRAQSPAVHQTAPRVQQVGAEAAAAPAPQRCITEEARTVVLPVRVRDGESIVLYAEWSDTSLDDLLAINGMSAPSVLSAGQDVSVLIAKENLSMFLSSRLDFQTERVMGALRHEVRNLAAVAQKSERAVKAVAFKAANARPVRQRSGHPRTLGTRPSPVPDFPAYLLPAGYPATEEYEEDAVEAVAVDETPPVVTIRVRKGETLEHYRRWGRIPIRDILTMNPNVEPLRLRLGQSVSIPLPVEHFDFFFMERKGFTGAPVPERYTSWVARAANSRDFDIHRVAPGETAWNIARDVYQVRLDDLQRANPDKDLARLREGDIILIPGSRRS
jgi:LysM repeat protein